MVSDPQAWLLWALLMLPLAGAVISALAPTSITRWIAPGVILVAFLCSIGATRNLAASGLTGQEQVLGDWLPSLGAEWALYFDRLSAALTLIITGIGFFIHLYSTAYMEHEKGFCRYFAYLNLFVFFMLLLVLANNYALMFAGWEGVGMCSYLVIGFNYQRLHAARAGLKAFLVNRCGDASLLIGLLMLLSVTGSLHFAEVTRALATHRAETGFGVLTAIAILLFAGAAGKSAQTPLHVWLPDAMEGPTPASALIHAATMVTAGVYLVARISALYQLAPNASTIVGAIGAASAIFASTLALAETDIKRVLAYSTISQLGYMFLALGLGAYGVAIFHLFTHAFFKAALFLGAGSVIHSLGGEQDMRRMGGLRRRLPVTHAVMFAGAIAISGLPGVAGFFSKDAILEQAFSAGAGLLYAIGLATAGLTAFYMWRLMHLTFYGQPRRNISRAHEGGPAMTVAMIVLGFGSIVSGWLGVPAAWHTPALFRSFAIWLEPVFANVPQREPVAGEWILSAVAAAVAFVGIALARYFYRHRAHVPHSVMQALQPLHGILAHRWYFDSVYRFVFIDAIGKGGGRLLARFDRTIVDGGVNLAGRVVRSASRGSIFWDTWIVDGAVRATAIVVTIASFPVRVIQSGRVQTYALYVIAGLALFLTLSLLLK